MLDTPFIDFGPGTPFGDEPDEDIIITATVAPAAEPLEDGDLLSSIANFATLDSTANYASSASPTIASVQWLVDGVDQAGTYALSAGQSVVLRVTDGDTPANFRDWTIDASVAAIAPAQFGTGDWSLANDGVNVTLTVSTLPDDGGSALTDLEYAVNGGGYASLGAAATGDYTITASEGDTVTLRAVNAVGNGTASASKTVPAGAFDPLSLFGVGDEGYVLDPVDITSLFTDLAHSTQVTAHLDPVGSVLDLSPTGIDLAAPSTSDRMVYNDSGGLKFLSAGAASNERLVASALGVLTNVDDLTLVVAFSTHSNAAKRPFFAGNLAADYLLVESGGNRTDYKDSVGRAVANTFSTETDGTIVVQGIVKNGATTTHYKNTSSGDLTPEVDPPLGTFAADLSAALELRGDGANHYYVFLINRAITGTNWTDLWAFAKGRVGR